MPDKRKPPYRITDPKMLIYPNSRADASVRPLYYLRRTDWELFFVNHTDEVLPYVSNCSRGIFLFGDEPEDMVATAQAKVRYENVLPGESILIDTYDMMDFDCILQSVFKVASPNRGTMTFIVSHTGGPQSGALLWEDGYVPRAVRMEMAE